MAANNAGHTRLRGDWNPCGICHDLLHEGVTLTKCRSVKVLIAWSAYVAEAASLYRNSDVFSCSDA